MNRSTPIRGGRRLELDPMVAAWLDEGPRRLPDAARQDIVAEVRALPQRRAGALLPSRLLLLAAATGAVAVVVLALAMAGGLLRNVGPAPSAPPPTGPPPSAPTATEQPTAPPADAALRRPRRTVGFDFELLPGMEVHDTENRRVEEPPSGPQGWIAFTIGGPGPYGLEETGTSSTFVAGTRGVVISDVSDAWVGHGEEDPNLSSDPMTFLTDLDAKSVYVVDGIREGELGGLPAAIGRVRMEREWYSHLEDSFMDLWHPSVLFVARVGGAATVAVQVWAETEEELEAWLPDAMPFVESIRFVHVNGIPVDG